MRISFGGGRHMGPHRRGGRGLGLGLGLGLGAGIIDLISGKSQQAQHGGDTVTSVPPANVAQNSNQTTNKADVKPIACASCGAKALDFVQTGIYKCPYCGSKVKV